MHSTQAFPTGRYLLNAGKSVNPMLIGSWLLQFNAA